ncbi:MAG: MarR family transcriptional regulator [Pseudomonadota bacterium]
MQWAVFTGDIVGSSSVSAQRLDGIMHVLEASCRDMSDWVEPTEPGQTAAFAGFARRGGDGWQIALNRPKFCLRAAIYLQARIRANGEGDATRIAVATGDGDPFRGQIVDPNSAHGPAFEKSGRLLQNLGSRTRLAFAGSGLLDASFRLADHISQGWTAAQARAVAAMLPPGSGPRRRVAEDLGISRQAVDQALNAAGFPAIDAALALIEAEI